jgi:hypothetical protein
MAIRMLKRADALEDAGLFNLPPAFDKTRYAAQWVPEGSVDMMKLRQPLTGIGATADGWEVWKSEGAKGQPVKITTSGKQNFVLMCRSRKIQDQVNALYGNVSKRVLNREIQGETVEGGVVQDPGILTEQQLKSQGGGGSLAEESLLPLNEEPVDEPTAAINT